MVQGYLDANAVDTVSSWKRHMEVFHAVICKKVALN